MPIGVRVSCAWSQMTETETVQIPGGNRGVRLVSGEVLNVALASVKSLVRCGDEDFRRVVAWLEAERSANAKRQAQREEEQSLAAAQIRRDAEARAESFERMQREEPWKFA